MDIRLIGQGFPFEGLKATTTVQLQATAGFEISNKIPEANIQVEVADDGGTAGENLEVVIKWRNIPKRDDIINLYIHNDCWDGDVKYKVVSEKHTFSSSSGQITLEWKVPFDASLSQLNFLGYDDFAGLEVCRSDNFFLSLVLEKDKITEYHSNEFTLLVNAVDGGYGVTSPQNNAVLYAGELNSFEWNHLGYNYFYQGDPCQPASLVNVQNVSVVLYGAETDCIGSDLIDTFVQLFDPRWGCEESWVQIAASTPNDGTELLYIPYQTLDGKDLRDFHEVRVTRVGARSEVTPF